jgi:carbonic anhydrase
MPYRVARIAVFAGLVIAALVGARFAGAQAAAPAPAQAHWSYEGATGPEQWGYLDPAFEACKTGTNQSPINIQGATPGELAPIKFDYKLTPLKIINNGHTVQVNYGSGSTITVNGEVYELVQFHFHHPGEAEIDGQKYDLEMHLVHRNAHGKLLVVAVLMKSGSENFPLHVLWSYLPTDIGKEAEHKKVQLNAEDFLPNDRNYYTYSGSLTAPPCSENVDWYVMKKPVEISPAQIATFAKLYPDNARPLQPTNDRKIQESNFKKAAE